MRRSLIGSLVLATVALAACQRAGSIVSGSAASTSGAPSSSCVQGWTSPSPGSHGVPLVLRVIRTTLGLSSPLRIDAIRYFQGPESPPSDQNYLKTVDRWYVKAQEKKQPSMGARFLVERRQFGIGLSAAAPFDTTGFHAGDWTGFQHDTTADLTSVDGVPGKVRAVTYDFVDGGEGLTFPGLPDAVVGCLEGT